MANISVETDEWVSLSTLSGVTVGNSFKIQNKGVVSLLVTESASQPDIEDLTGEVITTLALNESSKIVLSGGDEVWARVRNPKGGLILVYTQEIIEE